MTMLLLLLHHFLFTVRPIKFILAYNSKSVENCLKLSKKKTRQRDKTKRGIFLKREEEESLFVVE